MDRMTETEAMELLDKIDKTHSYLFLGQAYQRESLNKNSYLDRLYAETGCSDSIHSWRNLLEEHSDSIDQIYDTADVLSRSSSNPFLSELVNLHWNLFITTSPESMINCQSRPIDHANIKLELVNREKFSPSLFKKEPKHRLHLFGCYDQDNHDFNSQLPKNSDDLDEQCSRVANKAWSTIKTIISGQNGILVVDGWDPDTDWLPEEIFLREIDNWYNSSIYFFGVNSDQLLSLSGRRIKSRIKKEGDTCNIHFFSGTLRENLQDALEEYQEENYEWAAESRFHDADRSVTLECAGRQKIFSLPPDMLQKYKLSLPNVSFLEDNIEEYEPPVTEDDRKSDLMLFLASGNDSHDPYWRGFHENSDLYLSRGDLDSAICQKTKETLEQSDVVNSTKVTLLPGSSYCGKSVVLANLAYQIKHQHQFPVVFIRGRFSDEEESAPQSLEILKEMLGSISNILREQSKTAQNPDGTLFKILVVWDRNSLLSSKVYVKYKNALAPYKVVIVGSTLDVNPQPTKNLDYFDKIDSAFLKRADEKKLFNYISPWFGQQFDALYDKVFQAYQRMRHNDLGDIDYDYTKYPTVKYTDVFLRVLDEICSSSGSRADLKYRNDQRSRRLESTKDIDDRQINSIATYMLRRDVRDPISEKLLTHLGVTDLNKDVTDCIQKCNAALAVSSCFNIDLPMEIVNRIVAPLQMQCRRLRIKEDVLRYNNMLYVTSPTDGVDHVRYLHFDDALSYVRYIAKKHNKSETEIAADALCDIIENSSLDNVTDLTAASNRLVLNLVRYFSPNSPNEVLDDYGDLNKALKKSTVIYDKKLYLKIADELDKKIRELIRPDKFCQDKSHLDACLLSASLRREQFSVKLTPQKEDVFFSNNADEPFIRKIFDDANEALENLVVEGGDDKMAMRASAEICANRVRLLPPYTQDEKRPKYPFTEAHMQLYEDICKYFERAVNLRTEKNMQEGFSPISLLDIYLNAFLKYANGFKKAEKYGDTTSWKAYNRYGLDRLWDSSLRQTVEYINKLLFESAFEEIDTIRLDKISKALKITDTGITKIIANLKKEKNIAFLTLEGLQKWNDEDNGDGQVHNDYLMIRDRGTRRDEPDLRSEKDLENIKVSAKDVRHAQEVIDLFDQEEIRYLLDQQQPSLSAASCAEMRLRNRWIAYTHHMPFVSKQGIGLDENQWKTLYDDACDAVRLAYNAKQPYVFALFVQYMYCILTGETEKARDIQKDLSKTGYPGLDYVILCCPPEDGKEPVSWGVRCTNIRPGTIHLRADFSGPIKQTANDWIHISRRQKFDIITQKSDVERSIQKEAEIRFRLDGPVLNVITYRG